MSDLTIIYLTVNRMPGRWMEFQLAHMRRAAKNIPIISISREPIELGHNIIQTEPFGYWNIYRQLCRGATIADTQYVAVAEDDCLYPPHHFESFRPPDDAVSYNRARWSLFVWDPIYCLRQRVCNCSLIAPRQLVIDAIQERMEKHPDGDSLPRTRVGEIGRYRVEKLLGVTHRRAVEWYSTAPLVQLNHDDGIDPAQRVRRKMHGQLRAHDIPYWGKAVDIASVYLGHKTRVPRQHREKTVNV